MKPLLYAVCDVLLALSFAAGQVTVQGNESDAVTITCSHTWAERNRKYFCRDPCNSDKDVIVDSLKRSAGRYQLNDAGNVFTVTINPLEISDTGKYWCAVERAILNTYNEIILTVLPAPQITPSPTSNTYSHSPTLITSLGTTASSTTTQVTVFVSTNQPNDNQKPGWQLYLLVSLGVIMLVSLVGSLTFMTLYNKRTLIKSLCCSGRRQSEVSDYEGSPVRNQNSTSHNPSPAATESSPDYENILRDTIKFTTQNVYTEH